MSANLAVEQHNPFDKFQSLTDSGNDLDVIDLFKQDRERKLQEKRDLKEEAGGGGSARNGQSSPAAIETERARKMDPRRRVIERFAELAGRALAEFNPGGQTGGSAVDGLAVLIHKASNTAIMLPSFDLV